jgi:hypothetical protein
MPSSICPGVESWLTRPGIFSRDLSMARPLVPSDLHSPSEALIAALARCALAAARGDAASAQTIRLIFGDRVVATIEAPESIKPEKAA